MKTVDMLLSVLVGLAVLAGAFHVGAHRMMTARTAPTAKTGCPCAVCPLGGGCGDACECDHAAMAAAGAKCCCATE